MIRLFLLLLILPGTSVLAQHNHHQMHMDADGMVMNANSERLPRGCEAVSRDYQFTVHAGREYAEGVPGMIFGMSQHELRVDPCSRITVTFINEDQVRHQWMVHGLPVYLYQQGMFHMEASGGATQTGTFIAPADDRTYLIHCDMAQHMENGMKGQLVVGGGSGDLWSVPEVGQAYTRANYFPDYLAWLLVAGVVIGVSVAIKSGHSG